MSLTIDGISTKFDISERTVFRDLKTLRKLGYAVDFNNGYRLADSSLINKFKKLGALRLELKSFALKTHPLRRILPLEELSRWVRDCIGKKSIKSFLDL